MPKPVKGESEDEEDDRPRRKKLTAPIRKTTMMPAKNHPQRLVMIEREKMKPAENLEAWFEIGLVKHTTEAKGHHKPKPYVTGGRPLPPGYTGCNAEATLVQSGDNGILIWPIRVSLHLRICEKKPWTLYHYCHQASFEAFHQVFHEISTLEEEAAQKKLLDLMQKDYQERVPNPTNINVKGEPQLTTMEPIRFGNKTEALNMIFGKEAITGYSKQGNRHDQFADYCIAVECPASACFQNTSQPSKANVRICRETLEQLQRRAEAVAAEEARKAKENGGDDTEGAETHEGAQKKSVGCLARLCGVRRPEKVEFWDEVEPTHKSSKKKDREMDRWKQRLAKKWLDEHVMECAQEAAKQHRTKDEEERYQTEQRALAERAKRTHGKVDHAMQVNEMKKGPTINFGITKTINQLIARFTPDKTQKLAEIHYRQEANREVVQASALFRTGKNKGSTSSLHDDVNEGRVADEHMKRMWRAVEQEEKKNAPTGTKRKVIDKKKAKAMAAEAAAKDSSRRGSRTSLKSSEIEALGEKEKELLDAKDKEREGGEDKELEKHSKDEQDKEESGATADKEEGGDTQESPPENAEKPPEGEGDKKEKRAVIVSPRSTPPASPKKAEGEAEGEQPPNQDGAADSGVEAEKIEADGEAAQGEGADDDPPESPGAAKEDDASPKEATKEEADEDEK